MDDGRGAVDAAASGEGTMARRAAQRSGVRPRGPTPWRGAWSGVVGLVLVLGCGACGDEAKRPIGGLCEASAECATSLCMDGVCVDPDGDEDRDGLTNGFEAGIGSNGFAADTDEDGVGDRDEVGADLSVTDSDGDGKGDIVESLVRDADGDCITDQRDAEDGVMNGDLAPMVAVVCPGVGVCGAEGAVLAASCVGGTAVCDFSRVPGYAAVEACNALDDDCDGETDEGFVAGCVARSDRPWLVPATSGTRVQSAKYRGVLVLGSPTVQVMSSARHKAWVGLTPNLGAESGGAP